MAAAVEVGEDEKVIYGTAHHGRAKQGRKEGGGEGSAAFESHNLCVSKICRAGQGPTTRPSACGGSNPCLARRLLRAPLQLPPDFGSDEGYESG